MYVHFQVILCGEYGVGKTSLFRRYATNTFVTATDRSSTLGLDHFGKVFKVGNAPNPLSTPGKDLKLQVEFFGLNFKLIILIIMPQIFIRDFALAVFIRAIRGIAQR